jgi:hypothetical protein
MYRFCGGYELLGAQFCHLQKTPIPFLQSFNKGWRFYQGNSSGTLSAADFDDGSWQKVNDR